MTMFAALLLAATTTPFADPACAKPVPLVEPWTRWSQSGQAKAGTQAQGAPSLILGKPVAATLTPVENVQFAAASGKGAKDGYGGLFNLSVKTPTRIGVALSGPVWIDVVTGDQSVASVDHGHGPECSGIRKIVWFDLPAGRHIIQIAGAKAADIRVMAADAKANQPTP